jgi:uncharacterized membrane protein YkvA (DUF1232 family)
VDAGSHEDNASTKKQAMTHGRVMLRILKAWARRLIRDVHAVYLAARDPRMPWYVRVLAIAVAGYALSPIDLIPDFIPVIGYADDLIIVPLGIWLVVSLIPNEVMVEYRAKAIEAGQRPRSKIAAIVIIAIWVFVTAVLVRIGFAYWGK